jgi:hypothetical protein
MVLQVGDKVIVYNAGTDHATAVKIDPVQVGDKVSVVTLSDGTKIPLPRIDLDLSDFVWVVPEWEPGVVIGGGDIQYGCLPLGASVFTLTDIIDCWTVEDAFREWESGELAGNKLIPISGTRARYQYQIVANSTLEYELIAWGDGPITVDSWVLLSSDGAILSSVNLANGKLSFDFINPSRILMQYISLIYRFPDPIADNFPEENTLCSVEYVRIPFKKSDATRYLSARIILKYRHSPTGTVSITLYDNWWTDWAHLSGVLEKYFITTELYNKSELSIEVLIYIPELMSGSFSIGPISFIAPSCPTDGIVAGDKYVIYDPVTKCFVFNDSTKTVLSAEYWRAVGTPGEELSIASVEYAWDGKGYVYLSASKTVMSTIYFDNEIRVDGTAAGATKTIAYHAGEQITYGGETVSRELVNITAALRAGKNSVVITVKDTGGAKIGFPTAVYIKRSMTAVSL